MAAVGAFAARIAGVTTKRIAIAISLFSLFAFGSRLANLFYAPLLGTISDRTGNAVAHAIAAGAAELADPALAQFAFAIAADRPRRHRRHARRRDAAADVRVYLRARDQFVRTARLDAASALPAVRSARAGRGRSARFDCRDPSRWQRYKLVSVPMKLLIANTVVQSVYAIGVVAAVYASVRDPAFARTATLLSGIVNGSARSRSRCSSTRRRPGSSIRRCTASGRSRRRAMVFWLTVTMVLGTLISQLLLYPAALVIDAAAHLGPPVSRGSSCATFSPSWLRWSSLRLRRRLRSGHLAGSCRRATIRATSRCANGNSADASVAYQSPCASTRPTRTPGAAWSTCKRGSCSSSSRPRASTTPCARSTVADRYAPGDPRIDSLPLADRTGRDQARDRRLELPGLPRNRDQLLRSFAQVPRNRKEIVATLHRFAYTYDSNEIIAGHPPELRARRAEHRAHRSPDPVPSARRSGVPEDVSSAAVTPTAPLLPLP